MFSECDCYSTFYKRLGYGFSFEDAHALAKNKPRWMAVIERDEGFDFIEILKRERSCGVSDAQIARSFSVHKDTLGHWIRKWKNAGLL